MTANGIHISNGSRGSTHQLPNALVWGVVMNKSQVLVTAGGRIICRQCQATSKRSKQQCRAPAMTGKNVCLIHGGRSTGPRTPEGLARCLRKIHGHSIHKARTELSLELQQLAVIEAVALRAGVITEPSRGRKPGWRKLT